MASKPDYDLLIRNCSIVDGSGSDAFQGDVAVANGKIAAVGPELTGSSAQVIESPGSVVCPGFIDSHTHDDLYLLFCPDARAKIRQGVTTVVLGHCGISAAPGVPEHWDDLRGSLGMLGAEYISEDILSPMTFGQFLDRLAIAGPGINIASLVGHSTIRLAAMGPANRLATPVEMDRMRFFVQQAMQQGAFGISTGLIYPPGAYADTGELISLAKEAAAYGGLYSTHLRSEGSGVDMALAEALEIGRQASAKVLISHHKVAGLANWGHSRFTLEMIETAMNKGQDVAVDQYPYAASSTYLSATLPPDIQEGGTRDLCRKLKDPLIRESIRQQMKGNAVPGWESFMTSVGIERIVISSSPSRPDLAGMSLSDISQRDRIDPLDIVFDLIIGDEAATGAIYHSMDEDDVSRIMARDYVMIGSDGLPAFSSKDNVHPRFFGTFPRVLGHYVREKRLLSLEDAVRKMTSLTARTYGLMTKGLIRPGMDADLVIFDPETIIDRATFEHSANPPDGIQKVILGGKVAVDGGQVTGMAQGQVLRKNMLP